MKIKITVSIKIGNANYDYALSDSIEKINNINPEGYIKSVTKKLIRFLLKNKALYKELNAEC